jgi:NADH dehydrogenase [ubiquinone] 1 alpha subcomplex assembly factor 7
VTSSALIDILKAEGPVPVERFFELSVSAYYAQGTAFGRSGDFTTAPEISQVFGELIGGWCALTWESLGKPNPFLLVELGPGRGTLMADLMRAASQMPGFCQASRPHLVETSPALRQQQADALSAFNPVWHETLATVPKDNPLLIVANEFLDALPIRQFVRQPDGWHERLVEIGPHGKACFCLSRETSPDAAALLAPSLLDAPIGAIAEACPTALRLIDEIALRLQRQNGSALIIDYGPLESGIGDSLQAVRGHAFVPVLDNPGQVDLTAHVDFAALAHRARAQGLCVWGPVMQGVWLQRLGILERTRQLAQGAKPLQNELLLSGTRRLIDPKEMGTLFKLLALTLPGFPVPSGFEVS